MYEKLKNLLKIKIAKAATVLLGGVVIVILCILSVCYEKTVNFTCKILNIPQSIESELKNKNIFSKILDNNEGKAAESENEKRDNISKTSQHTENNITENKNKLHGMNLSCNNHFHKHAKIWMKNTKYFNNLNINNAHYAVNNKIINTKNQNFAFYHLKLNNKNVKNSNFLTKNIIKYDILNIANKFWKYEII